MDTFKHVFRPAVWIAMLTFAFTTMVSMVLADHRNPPQVYLMFDGIDDYVQVEHHADLSIATTGQLTVAVWMKPATLYFPTTERDGYVHWLGKGGHNQHEWAFRMYSKDTIDSESPRQCPDGPLITTRQNRISFYVFNPDEASQGVGSYFQYAYTPCAVLPQPVKAGEWIHVVGIADGERTHIYKDGILMDSDRYSGTIRPTVGEEPLRMGTRELDKSYFLGGLGEIRIWNRALSHLEVSELYHFNRVPKGLVAQWLLNERTGTTALDTIGGHHGTIFGAYRPVR